MTSTFDPANYLPHRGAALILEGLQVEEGALPRCHFVVRSDCHYVHAGHLTFAGVVEAMAQAAAVHLNLRDDAPPPSTPGFLVGLEDLEITALPEVGQNISIFCDATESFGPSLWVQTHLEMAGVVIAQGTLKVFISAMEEGEK